MISQNVLDYIKSQLELKVPIEKIRKDLMDNGWTSDDVNQAISSLNPKPSVKPEINIPKPESILPISNNPHITRSINLINSAPEINPQVSNFQDNKIENKVEVNQNINTNQTLNTNQPNPINSQPFTNPQDSINKQNPSVFVPKQNIKKNKGPGILILITLVLIALASGFAYAYTTGFNFFSKPPYTQENLISGLTASFSNIESGTYKMTGSINVMQRESNTIPYTINKEDNPELLAKYQRDYDRYIAVTGIVPQLKYLVKNGKYPVNLNNVNSKNSYYKYSTIDPLTKKPYEYSLIDNGKDFNLKVQFETDQAIKSIEKYKNIGIDKQGDNIKINDKTVIFNSKSLTYFYVSKTPPPSFFESLDQMMKFIPNDMDISFSLGMSSDWGVSDNIPVKWKANVDATGKFSDLSYKVNADTIKDNDVYYFRINNIPSLYSFNIEKGQWYEYDPKENNKNGSSSPYISNSFSNLGKTYKENKNEIIKGINVIAKIADEKGLYKINGPIKKEKVGNESLYRYDLVMVSEALKPFYEEISKVTKANNGKDSETLKQTIETIDTKQYQEVLEYIKNNSVNTLWVDGKGIPRVMEYSLKVAPPDENTKLKNKQVVFKFKFELSDVNKKINIQVPNNSKSINDLLNSSSRQTTNTK